MNEYRVNRERFPEIEKTEAGYYRLRNIPSEEELRQYYALKYYQENKGSYQQEYSEDEKRFFRNKVIQKAFVVNELRNDPEFKGSMIDIGCGEGWPMAWFYSEGWEVCGLDYSDFGLLKTHPHLAAFLRKGNIYDEMESLIGKGRKFDVIWLTNVLEHVPDPEKLVGQIKLLCHKGSVAVITVPNDFSDLQLYLLETGKIEKPFWIATPDHISYFGRESLVKFMENSGWKTGRIISDYPIDLQLLHQETNYIRNKSAGKAVHLARVEAENFLHELGPAKVNRFYESLAETGLGRQLTGFFLPAE